MCRPPVSGRRLISAPAVPAGHVKSLTRRGFCVSTFSLYRSTVGFDRLFQMLDGNAADLQSYPPYNIERSRTTTASPWRSRLVRPTRHRGEGTALTVSGKRTEDDKRSYRTRASPRAIRAPLPARRPCRGFGRESSSTACSTSRLKRVIPDAKKPRRIEIAAAARPARPSRRRRPEGPPAQTGRRAVRRAPARPLSRRHATLWRRSLRRASVLTMDAPTPAPSKPPPVRIGGGRTGVMKPDVMKPGIAIRTVRRRARRGR